MVAKMFLVHCTSPPVVIQAAKIHLKSFEAFKFFRQHKSNAESYALHCIA